MQRLLSRCRFHLSAVSFPSLPSLLVKSGLELEEDWLLVTLDEPELVELEELPALDFSWPELDELPPELEGLVGDEVDWVFVVREISSLCSQ